MITRKMEYWKFCWALEEIIKKEFYAPPVVTMHHSDEMRTLNLTVYTCEFGVHRAFRFSLFEEIILDTDSTALLEYLAREIHSWAEQNRTAVRIEEAKFTKDNFLPEVNLV